MIRLTLALWIGSCALVAAAMSCGWSNGQARVGDLQLHNLELCDNKPCFMSITPGVTRWNAAESLLAKRDALNAYDTLIVSLDDVEIRAWRSFDRSKVSLISLRRRPNAAV